MAETQEELCHEFLEVSQAVPPSLAEHFDELGAGLLWRNVALTGTEVC